MKRLVILLCVAVIIFPGCVSWGYLDKNNIGHPTDSVLVYGSFLVANDTESSKYAFQPSGFRFTQLNPLKKPGHFGMILYRYSFTLPPQEPGAYLKCTYYELDKIDRYIYWVGIQYPLPIDFQVPEKPGLYYIGSYIIKRTTDEVLYAPKVRSELETLQDIINRYKNTDWEPLLLSRIQELTNAQ